MALEHHERGVVVPGAYTQPPVHAPVASIEALVEGGYVAGPIAPMLGDFGPADTEWVDGLQDALMIMAGVVSRRAAKPAEPAKPRSRRSREAAEPRSRGAGEAAEPNPASRPLRARFAASPLRRFAGFAAADA